MQARPATTGAPQDACQLLQLPGPAMNLVLRYLDQYSLACAAATCSTLCHAVPGSISQLEVCCNTSATYQSLIDRVKKHSSSLSNVEQCSVVCREPSRPPQILSCLPCPRLRKLHLQDCAVQLEPADGSPGVLHDCSGLTALDLQHCWVKDASAGAAAIAAQPQLRTLKLAPEVPSHGLSEMMQRAANPLASAGRLLLPELEHLVQLTHLNFACCELRGGFGTLPSEDSFSRSFLYREALRLRQLSALVNLEHLELSSLPSAGLPASLPSQLTKLTRLYLGYMYDHQRFAAQQFRQLSSLSTLQHLTLASEADSLPPDGMTSIQCLSQLTCLELLAITEARDSIEFTRNFTQGWSRLTALQSLTLQHCRVAPEALVEFTQLRALHLQFVVYVGDGNLQGLLNAVSQLSLLTGLTVSTWAPGPGAPPPAAAFTALTASTNLCSLQLGLHWQYKSGLPAQVDLLRQGMVYPHLCRVELGYRISDLMPLSKQQLQQLCYEAAPHADCLRFRLCPNPTPDTLRPLLQLSGLSKLELSEVGPSAAAVGAAVHIVAQLTDLQMLWLSGLPHLEDPNMLQLTVLTALQGLTLSAGLQGAERSWLQLHNKARPGNPPDVWAQLLRRFLQEQSCRQALLTRSPAAAAALVELMLVQLAAAREEELAAGFEKALSLGCKALDTEVEAA